MRAYTVLSAPESQESDPILPLRAGPSWESHLILRPLPHLHIRRNFLRTVKSQGASENMQGKGTDSEKIAGFPVIGTLMPLLFS